MEIKKGYYAVIPADVRYDKKLCANSKLLYSEITALCSEKGFCWANNQYFQDLYEVGKNTIVRWINELISCGYITKDIQYAEDGKTVLQRRLSIASSKKIIENIDGCGGGIKNDTRWYQKCDEGGTKNDTTPGIKNDTHNNTSNNNTENSKKESKNKENIKSNNSAGAREYDRESYAEVLARLGYSADLQTHIFKFIQFQQANKKIIKKAMLEKTMRSIEGDAERRIRRELPGGLTDRMNANLSCYHEDLERYIQESIQQALSGKWLELKEPKGFKTTAEWEREANEDMGIYG